MPKQQLKCKTCDAVLGTVDAPAPLSEKALRKNTCATCDSGRRGAAPPAEEEVS